MGVNYALQVSWSLWAAKTNYHTLGGLDKTGIYFSQF